MLIQLRALQRPAPGRKRWARLVRFVAFTDVGVRIVIDRFEERWLVTCKLRLGRPRLDMPGPLTADLGLVSAVLYLEDADLSTVTPLPSSQDAVDGIVAADRGRTTSALRELVAAMRNVEEQTVEAP